MPNTPSESTDDALLARLNALKKSSVTWDATPPSATTPARSPAPSDDLAARFARLGSASPSASPKPSRTDGAPAIAPGAPSYLEGIAEGIGGGGDVEFNEEDERSLEELLGELGGKDQWDISGKDEEDMGKLLRDMKSILPQVQRSMAEEKTQQQSSNAPTGAELNQDGKPEGEGLTDWENVEVDIGSGGVKVGREGQQNQSHDNESEDEEQNKKKNEDEEADDIISRVMAELAIAKKYGDLEETPDQASSLTEPQAGAKETRSPKGDGENDGDLSLPSAPSTIPQDDLDRTQALEDALTARLAALSKSSPTPGDSLGLPSAPSFSPAKKVIKSNLPKFTDEEIDSWCIICNDDATLKCMGCDGDLYCQNCWMEGHRGESAGYEERKHKAVLYNKKGSMAAAG